MHVAFHFQQSVVLHYTYIQLVKVKIFQVAQKTPLTNIGPKAGSSSIGASLNFSTEKHDIASSTLQSAAQGLSWCDSKLHRLNVSFHILIQLLII